MKIFKHWKLELLITILAPFIIGLFYWLFSPFYGQILFVPLLFAVIPLFLVRRYKLLLCYPLGASLTYSLLLLSLSGFWPIDWSLFALAFGSVFFPTVIGYIFGFLALKFLNPAHKRLIPIHILAAFLIAYLTASQALARIDTDGFFYYLSLYLLLPLVFITSQALISFLYPSNRMSPLVNAGVFLLINGFATGHYFTPFALLYLALAYGTIYIIKTLQVKQNKTS